MAYAIADDGEQVWIARPEFEGVKEYHHEWDTREDLADLEAYEAKIGCNGYTFAVVEGLTRARYYIAVYDEDGRFKGHY